MKIYFNSLGVVVNTVTNDESLRQGNVNANTLQAFFEGKNNINYTAYLGFTRSDGSKINDIAMVADNTDPTKYSFLFNDLWYFALSGETTASVKLVNSAGVTVVSGQITFNIEPTDFESEDPHITPEQLLAFEAEIAAKLDIDKGVVVLNTQHETLSGYTSEIEEFNENQVFLITYGPLKGLYYKNNYGSLASLNIFFGYFHRAGVMSNGTALPDSAIQEISKRYCFFTYTNANYLYFKESVDNNIATFRMIPVVNHTADTVSVRIRSFQVSIINGVVSNIVDTELALPKKAYVDENFLNKAGDDATGLIKFYTIPETSTDVEYAPSNDNQLANMGKVKEVQGNLDTHIADQTNPHNVNKSQVGLGNVTNDPQVRRNEMGVALGVATLDSNGKLVFSQIPDILLGQMTYGGAVSGSGLAYLSTNAKIKLNTNLNSIQLTNDTTDTTGYIANQGLFYLVKSSGSFADLDLKVGDWLVAYERGWEKIDNTDAVRTVQGRIGDVVITKGDIGLAYIESDIAPLYDSTATYAANDVVIYNGKLYKANVDIATPEEFDSDHWTEIDVKTLIANLKNYTDNQLNKLPQYIDITIAITDWMNNECYVPTGLTGVSELADDDIINLLPNGFVSDGYIRAFGIEATNFNKTTGYLTLRCLETPTEVINVTLQVLRR